MKMEMFLLQLSFLEILLFWPVQMVGGGKPEMYLSIPPKCCKDYKALWRPTKFQKQ